MKKILAIAISLVMVFAVAASAFALFGFKAGTTAVNVDNIVVDVTIYDDEYPASVGSNSLIKGFYPVHNPTSGVRAGDPVIALVELTIPAFDTLTAAGRGMLDGTGLSGLASMTIVTENVSNWVINPPNTVVTGTEAGFDHNDDMQTIPAPEAPAFYNQSIVDTNTAVEHDIPTATGEPGCHIGWFFTGRVTNLADASITAVFGVDDPAVAVGFGGTTCMIGNWAVTKDAATPTAYTMEERDNTAPFAVNDNRVTFAVNGPDVADNYNIISTYVSPDAGTTNYLVSQNFANGEIQYHNAITLAPLDRVSDPVTYALIDGILARAMKALGFTWTPGGVLYDEGFEALAARGLQFSDSETYYAYTAALTVAGAATVPDTGDTMVVGIVMMAVAILATAAVVIRKVRA